MFALGLGLGFSVVPVYSDMLTIARYFGKCPVYVTSLICIFRHVSPDTDQETLNGIVSGLLSSTMCMG